MSSGNVKDLRLRLGLSQAELAQLIGAGAMQVSKWERGVNAPKGVPARILWILYLSSTSSRFSARHVAVTRADIRLGYPGRALLNLLKLAQIEAGE